MSERNELIAAVLSEIADVLLEERGPGRSLVAFDYEMRQIDVAGTLENFAIALQDRARKLTGVVSDEDDAQT